MTASPNSRREFASDNYAGICPEAAAGLVEANEGHAPSYGEDPWTFQASELIREIFGTRCEVFFVFNGTAANSLALASICRSYHSIICHSMAHIEADECGAPGLFSNGATLTPVPGENGKLTPSLIEHAVNRRHDVHYPKPRALSLTQATELGTVYTPHELTAIGKMAQKLGLSIHMDGARFANAVVELGESPGKLTWEAGVDVLCLGGTKNGMAYGEAVVFFNKELAREFDFRCKQAGQLASKMRFIAAQWVGLLRNGAWLRHATHANRMARLLDKKLRAIPSLKVLYPCQANSVFVDMPPAVMDGLHQRGWHFYLFIGQTGARLMCAWDTMESDVEALVGDILELSKSK